MKIVRSTKTPETSTAENYQMSSKKTLNSKNENNGTLIGKNESNGRDFNMNLVGVSEAKKDSIKSTTLDQTKRLKRENHDRPSTETEYCTNSR